MSNVNDEKTVNWQEVFDGPARRFNKKEIGATGWDL